jgi:hypothetical protein
MKFAFKSIVAAAAFVAAGASSAAAVTVDVGGSTTSGNWILSELTGAGTLSFSPLLISALNAGGVQVAEVAPATVVAKQNTRFKYTSVSAAAPVTSLSGDLTGNAVTVGSVATAGGALQTAEDDGLTNTGGTLSITNLKVDLGAKRVYADITGGNGVGAKTGVHLWNFANITGSPTSFDLIEGANLANNEITGLTITTEAFGYFTQSLGLLEDGVSALNKVTDFGKISSSISVKATAVPEPSTYALMAVGLLGLSMVARRRAAK